MSINRENDYLVLICPITRLIFSIYIYISPFILLQAASNRKSASEEDRGRFGYRGVGKTRPPSASPLVEDRTKFECTGEEGVTEFSPVLVVFL